MLTIIGRGAAFAAPLALLLALSGCTAEPTSQAPAPSKGGAPAVAGGAVSGSAVPLVTSARIFPVDVTLDSLLRVEAQGEGGSGGQITYRYQWFVNNVPVPGATEPKFLVEALKKGDSIRVTVTPNDGKADGPVFEANPVTVGNTAPEIAEIQMEPVPLHRGDQLKTRVTAGDAEGDPIILSYKWFRNDKVVPDAKADTLDTKDFRKKDVLAVLITASDGKATREGHAGLPVTIINSPPRFTSVPPAEFKDGQYLYAVVVEDPDEDPVTLELKQGPPGMTLDPKTRQIVWKLTPQSAGKHHIVIAAKDSDNEVTQQEFDLDAQRPPEPPPGQ
ncbi:MAG: hypothetical protein Q7R68_09170 [Nitrospirales bacterium]|nr:hypothetical protein [Nitrospirales bacterium]